MKSFVQLTLTGFVVLFIAGLTGFIAGLLAVSTSELFPIFVMFRLGNYSVELVFSVLTLVIAIILLGARFILEAFDPRSSDFVSVVSTKRMNLIFRSHKSWGEAFSNRVFVWGASLALGFYNSRAYESKWTDRLFGIASFNVVIFILDIDKLLPLFWHQIGIIFLALNIWWVVGLIFSSCVVTAVSIGVETTWNCFNNYFERFCY